MFVLVVLSDKRPNPKPKGGTENRARSYAIYHTNWRLKALKALQRRCNLFPLSKSSLCTRLRRLPFFDQQIETLQQDLTDIAAL